MGRYTDVLSSTYTSVTRAYSFVIRRSQRFSSSLVLGSSSAKWSSHCLARRPTSQLFRTCKLGRAVERQLSSAYHWEAIAGIAKVFLGRDEEAVPQLRHAIEINRNFQPAQFYLAAALAALGRLDEARVAAKDGLAMDPTFTIRRYRGDAPSDNPVFLAGRQRIYEMMRKVGLPEE